MKGKRIDLPEQEETECVEIDGVPMVGPRDALKAFSDAIERQRKAVDLAKPALDRLVKTVLTQRSGQCYKVRALLYSLWNGQETSLSEVCGLDYDLRSDLCCVLLAWGYGRGDWEFFYDALESRVRAAGQWNWFLEAEKGGASRELEERATRTWAAIERQKGGAS